MKLPHLEFGRASIVRPFICLSTLCLLGFGTIVCSPTGAAEGQRKPNIVLIFADDLGINDLSCYGRQDQSTPNLDRLAKQGMRFTCSYCAQPICSPSRAAIMTGKTPARLHLTTFLPGRGDAPSQMLLHPQIAQQLPLEEITIAEHLKKAGYVTGMYGKWHLGGAGFSPKEQGFDEFIAGKANTKPSATEGGKGEYEITRNACDFIRKHKDETFFLYVPHNTPHIPLGAKPEYVDRHPDAFHPVYAAMMDSMDECVGQVMQTLDELQLADNTILIFTSDNGGLHVLELGIPPATHNTPFRAGKGYLYEGGLRVPCMIRWPGHIQPGESDVPFVNTDFPPTLLGLIGAEVPQGLDGADLSGWWLGKSQPPARTLYWHFPHYTNQGSRPGGAIREGDWKFVEHYEDNRRELFNLADDPSEEHDLSAEQPQRTQALADKLAVWKKEVGAQDNRPNPNYNPQLYKQIYEDIDTSRVKYEPTAVEIGKTQQAWRALMDEVVRRPKPAAGKQKP